jgi:hypothetical protein
MNEPELDRPRLTKAEREQLDRAEVLARIDVRQHNFRSLAPSFRPVVSQAASAEQCRHPDYVRWEEILRRAQGGTLPFAGWKTTIHRKVWEWAFILQVADQYACLSPGISALGFGVGTEPLPAVLASFGVRVLATDQGSDGPDSTAASWASSGQLMTGMDGLARYQLLTDELFRELVRVARVDMRNVPDELGSFDFIWSSCAMEHLGRPEQGLDFVMNSARLLAPGGVAVHTTEYELTARQETADWGNLACYRPTDIQRLADQLGKEGYEIDVNLHVPMDGPDDRVVSLRLTHGPDLVTDEPIHLKVAVADSVITSFGIVVRRPETRRRQILSRLGRTP